MILQVTEKDGTIVASVEVEVVGTNPTTYNANAIVDNDYKVYADGIEMEVDGIE